ncbi:MAG: cyanophycin synthetase [Xanthomonadales bacterium]|nr:cyanophycin synthetase [Xanthomonadales bacterium]
MLLALGEPLAEVGRALAALGPVAGRMNRVGGGEGQPLAVVDYAHTPDALAKALTALRAHVAGRLIVVFGCGGERDRGKRPEMGAIAERLADRVILTDDNPRGEDGDAIIADILAGMARPEAVDGRARPAARDRPRPRRGRARRLRAGGGQGSRALPGGRRRAPALR